jgi:Tol biopolymer transport system component
MLGAARTKGLLLVMAIAVLAAICVPLAGAAKDDLTLISRQSESDGGLGADNESHYPSISADGRFVAFRSMADNLSSEDAEVTQLDVFLRDTQTNTTTLVSRQSAADGGAGGNKLSGAGSISPDGRYVAFESLAENLSTGDADAFWDVFLRDTQEGTTSLVSRKTGPTGEGADSESFSPSISSDGHYVAFGSEADNLSEDDDKEIEDVFVRDTQANTTTLVSRASGESGAGGDEYSREPSISADGRYIAFESEAENLSTDDTNERGDVYVRDTQSNATTLISRAGGENGAIGDSDSREPSISADGRYVAFSSNAENLVANDENNDRDVFVRDTQANTTTLVSRQSAADGGVQSDRSADEPSISADGRYVAFETEADNLSTEDDDEVGDVFVRDIQAETTTLVSRQSAGEGGAGGDSASTDPAISADGRYVAFRSFADNLSPIDNDEFTDIFLRDVLGGPAGPTGSPPGSLDTTPPGLGGSKAKSPQVLGKPLKVKLLSDEDAAVTVTATATPQGQAGPTASKRKAVKFKAAKGQVRAGVPVTMKLKLAKGAARKLKAAAKAKAKITITATDAAGNKAVKKLSVKLR